MAIYVHHNSQQVGPYTVAEVKSQLASGALSIQDHVWWKGQQGWVPLGGSQVLEPGFKDPEGGAPKKSEELTGLSPFSIAALVAGCLFPFSFFTSIPAIVFGHCALHELKQNPKRTGRRMAIIGLVLGYVLTLVGIALVGSYFYFQNEITIMMEREDLMKSDHFVPPVPPQAPAPVAVQKPAESLMPTNAVSPVTNVDQPIAPSTASPTDSSTNSPPMNPNAAPK